MKTADKTNALSTARQSSRDWLSLGLEWTGTACGVSGALILASNLPFSPLGWVLFLFSSLLLCIHAIRIKAHGLTILQAAFICTNVLGISRWLI